MQLISTSIESGISEQEAQTGRCSLCHRRLLEHPDATVRDIARVSWDQNGLLVHKSCAVLSGIARLTGQQPT